VSAWAWWSIAAVVLTIAELHTGGFFLAPFAIGAVGSVIAALLNASAAAQYGVLLAVSALIFLFIRPVARRHMRTPPEILTGTAALVGQKALVLERVDPLNGSVRIGGEIWTARPLHEEESFEPGTQVQVVDIRGATAVVSELRRS
jgi:membrane protein implicated in regulation of membrane protease activity